MKKLTATLLVLLSFGALAPTADAYSAKSVAVVIVLKAVSCETTGSTLYKYHAPGHEAMCFVAETQENN